MSRIILILSGLGLVVLFQNCQKTISFSSNSGGNYKISGELIEVVSDDIDPDLPPGDDQPPVDEEQPPITPDEPKNPKGPPVTENPPDIENPPVVEPPGDDAGSEIVQEEDPEQEPPVQEPPVQDPPVQAPPVQGPGNFVCILDGPGKSVKLGLSSDDKLQGQNAVPRVLCMSEAACNDIASQKFTVKGPEKRGYCKENGNPNVFHINDADLAVKILE